MDSCKHNRSRNNIICIKEELKKESLREVKCVMPQKQSFKLFEFNKKI